MAQSMVCMISSSCWKLDGGLAGQGAANARLLNGRSTSSTGVAVRSNVGVTASAHREEEESTTATSTRRSMLSILVATVAAGALVKDASALNDIRLDGPPPLSGGLPGTENADEARDTDLNLKKRFFLQPLPADAAVSRIKEAVGEITSVKSLIDKKAWPYVQNDLRSKAQYLGFDLATVIDSKAKPVKLQLAALKKELFASINKLDYAARAKSSSKAEKAYAETVEILNKLVAQLTA